MIPATVNILETRGDTWQLTVELTDSAGAPFDLSGYSVLCQVRPFDPSDHRVWPLIVRNVLGPDGVVVLSTDPGVTDDASPLACDDTRMPLAASWDMQMTSPTGVTTTPVGGSFHVRRDISRP